MTSVTSAGDLVIRAFVIDSSFGFRHSSFVGSLTVWERVHHTLPRRRDCLPSRFNSGGHSRGSKRLQPPRATYGRASRRGTARLSSTLSSTRLSSPKSDEASSPKSAAAAAGGVDGPLAHDAAPR